MTDISDRLRDSDPVLEEPALSREEAAEIRRRVLDAAREPRAADPWLARRRTLAIAAALALIAGAGIDTARRAADSENRAVPVPSRPAAAAAPKTQLHFSTPGGTRIIWTIDPAFQLTERQ
jgi:hypothetical protein